MIFIDKKGFTLLEMLIVVAIIAVLIAIAIPVFTSQLERSREATDLANARSAYATVMVAAIDAGDSEPQTVQISLQQQQDGWTTDVTDMSIGDVPSTEWHGEPKASGSCTVTFYPDSDEVVIDWDAGEASGNGEGGGGETGNTPAGSNTETAYSIGNNVINLLSEAGSGNSTSVTITVRPDGTYDINVKGKKANITPEALEAKLKDQRLISDTNSIAFNGNDTAYPNGYTITIKKNNGANGGNITIKGI